MKKSNRLICCPLYYDPSQLNDESNRKRRDELSHNVFLMLQETNKFREHQSRELLIEILEKQLEQRENYINELENKITKVDNLLLDENSLYTKIATDEV